MATKTNILGKAQSNTFWTQTAIDCYNSHLICENCVIKNNLETEKCQMKACILELIRHGKYPPNHENSES
jgi:hypothetical protein